MPVVIGYDDYCANALMSGGAWSASAPLTNTQTDDVQEVAVSIDATEASTQYDIDLGSIQPVGMCVIGPVNLTEGEATYRIRSYTDADQLTTLYDSGVLPVTGTVVDWDDPDTWFEWEDEQFWDGIGRSDVSDLPLYLIVVIPEAQLSDTNAQYFKIEFSDENNIDGQIRVGCVKMFRAFRPAYNYSADGNDFSLSWLVNTNETLGGARFYWDRGVRRALRLSFPAISQDELFTDWFRIAYHSRLSKQIFIVPEENDDAPTMRKRAFLATFKQSPPIAQAAAGYGSTSIDLEEVI